MPTRSRATPEPAPSPAASPSGIAVDAYGGATVDPTKNVLDHVAAAIRRIDDLLIAQGDLVNAKLAHQSEVVSLRAAHNAEIGRLRAEHDKELRLAESGRLDAIRQVDVLGVQTLAQTTKDTAEAIRLTVEARAETIASQTSSLMGAINDRLAILEQSRAEGRGKEAVSDPMMLQLLEEVKSLRTSQASGVGKGLGLQAGWVYLVGGVGLIATVITIGGTVIGIAFALMR